MLGCHKQELEPELAGLSSAERSVPAYGFDFPPPCIGYSPQTAQRPSLLLNAGDPAGSALVSPNPECFRTDLPAGTLQLISIINGLWEEFAGGWSVSWDMRA